MDYLLLLLFIGQLVRTGLLAQVWIGARSGVNARSHRVGRGAAPRCSARFVLSNVPLAIVVTPSLTADATVNAREREKDWAVISFVATVAGNFLMTGSAANLIVASGAERAGYRGFTTARHALFGITTTLLVTATGVPILLAVYELW